MQPLIYTETYSDGVFKAVSFLLHPLMHLALY